MVQMTRVGGGEEGCEDETRLERGLKASQGTP